MAFVPTDGALEADGGKAGRISTVEVKDIGPMERTVCWRRLLRAGSLEAGHCSKRDNFMVSVNWQEAVVPNTSATNGKGAILAESFYPLSLIAAALTRDTLLFLQFLPHLLHPLLCSHLLHQSTGQAVGDGLRKVTFRPLATRRTSNAPFSSDGRYTPATESVQAGEEEGVGEEPLAHLAHQTMGRFGRGGVLYTSLLEGVAHGWSA